MNYEKENDYNNNHHGEYEDEGTVALRDNMNAKEMEYRKSIDTEKKVLTDGFHRLRDIKASIEHLQRLVEKGETRIEIDFDKWYQAALGEDDSCPSHEDLLTSVPRPLESCEDAASHASYQQQNINKPHIALPPGVQLTGNKDIDDNILGCCQELNKFDNGCNINVNAVEATPAASSRGTSATTTTTTTRPKSRIHHNEQDEQLLVGIWKEMTPTGATRSKMSQEFILPPGVELTGDKSIDDSIIACCMANEKLRQRYSNDR